MSKLAYNNNVAFNNLTASVSTGTLTHVTPLDTLKTRNLQDYYIFKISSTATVTIQSTVSEYIHLVAVLNCNIPSIDSFTIKYDTQAKTPDFKITKKRTIDGIDYYDHLFYFNSNFFVSLIKIEITGLNYLFNHNIGTIFLSNTIELKIKPSSLKIKTLTNAKYDTSNGNQVYSKTGVYYENWSFDCVDMTTDTLYSDTFPLPPDPGNPISLQSALSQYSHLPFLLIAEEQNFNFIYGYMKVMPSFNRVMARRNLNWVYQGKFQIEEEL